jgi:hypothetical protein
MTGQRVDAIASVQVRGKGGLSKAVGRNHIPALEGSPNSFTLAFQSFLPHGCSTEHTLGKATYVKFLFNIFVIFFFPCHLV